MGTPTIKKALIHSPYFQTLGGGERYTLTVAQLLLDAGYQVSANVNSDLIDQARIRFNLPLVGLIPLVDLTAVTGHLVARYFIQRQYDLIFWLTDGSLPFLFGRRNLVHFQVPLQPGHQHYWLNHLKSFSYSRVICNSNFTKAVVDRHYRLKSVVWHPPVTVEDFAPTSKSKTILAVGRFEKSLTEKRQDLLIDAFKSLVDNGLSGWRLVLAGGSYPGRDEVLTSLKKRATGYPVDFVVNSPYSAIKALYGQASIFWHAAGYGFDENRQPEKMEHFGMTTVEAMAAGCVPVVIGLGGQREIINHQQNGYLVYSKKELVQTTRQLISHPSHLKKLALQARQSVQRFGLKTFQSHLNEFLVSLP